MKKTNHDSHPCSSVSSVVKSFRLRVLRVLLFDLRILFLQKLAKAAKEGNKLVAEVVSLPCTGKRRTSTAPPPHPGMPTCAFIATKKGGQQ